jgi:hypothetical protein
LLQWKSTINSLCCLATRHFQIHKNILSFEQRCFYRTFISPEANVRSSSRNVTDAAMKQKKVYIGCCVTQYRVQNELNFTNGNSTFWSTILSFINYSPWRCPSKVWNMLELRKMLIKWWLNNLWLHSLVLIRYSDFSVRIWTT